MAILTITDKEHNNNALETNTTNVAHLNGMKSDGTPVKVPLANVLGGGSLSEEVQEKLTQVAGYAEEIEQLEEEVTQIATKADETDLAPLFDSTVEYTYGDLVTYDGELWMCHNPEGHTGAWVESDFVMKSLADILPSYCRKDGLYPNLTAGLAQGLVGDGTATSKKVLAYQFSADDNLSPYSSGVPSLSIKGRSIAWRQMVSGEDAGGDGPEIGGTYLDGNNKSHDKPYLMRAQTADGVWDWKVVLVATENTTFAAAAKDAFGYEQKVVADTETVLGSKCFDLVLAFGVEECVAWGTDSEANLKKVAQLWGFASFADFAGGTDTKGTLINTQWEYLTTYRAEGELISTKIPAVIRSYDSEGNLVAEREVPEAVLQAFPDGYLRQAGSVCDEINETECIKRVGVVDLGSLGWYSQSAKIEGLWSSNDFNIALSKDGSTIGNIMCKKYLSLTASYAYQKVIGISVHYTAHKIWLFDDYYSNVETFKSAMKGVYAFYELATPITTELSTPLSLQVLDATTMLKFAPTDTQEPYAPAQLDMSIDRDYAAIVKQLAINAGIWN